MSATPSLRFAVGATVAATGIALVASTALTGPSAVRANQLCYGAGVYGTVTGTHDAPTTCVPTSQPVLCTTPSAGLSPTIGVRAQACLPV